MPAMSKRPLTDFAVQAGISISYASDILNGKRTPTPRMALQIYRRTKRKVGPLNGATLADIRAMARLLGEDLVA